ncbi:unnamed protein product [Zymoseptoria tritici ST99CH_1A5]|uniref:Asl1-like glycosyl hydrolase catalytic domain-containing protein n=1 Tax=Zymoseptoria tritici ST99CH_1A5 TaxID=1276529 RepID=A0A1Y6LFG0_ZYMTR|nr:unnamed protein product [Zymoseptoria tritici ST99CH_1A5]
MSSTTSAGASADSASVRSSTTTSSKSLLTDPLDPATAGPILTSTSGSSSGTSSGSSSSTSSGVSTSALSSTPTVLSSSTSSSRPASSSTTAGVSTTGGSSATSTVSTTRSAASSSTPSSTTRSTTSYTLSSTTRSTTSFTLSYTTRSTTLSTTTSTTRSTTRSTTSSTSITCKPVPTASSGKRGLSFNDPKFTNLFSAISCTLNPVGRSRTSWAYNWFSAPCDNFNHASLCSVPFNPYLEFIPMLWSNDRDLQNVWNSNVQAAAARGWKTILAFNEPDIAHSGGSGMSIADAVTSWKQYIQPLKAQGFRLGSPAVTNAQGLNMGNDWQVKFLDQTPGKGGCIGCTVDFLAVHWYGGPTDFDSFFNHVAYSWSVVGGQRMPVWITEFGITGGTDAQVENFLRVVIDAFENQPYWSFVERYAWFTAGNSSPTSGPLVAANGTSLSRAGQVYENQV